MIKMDDLEREKKIGFDIEYIANVLDQRRDLKGKYYTPGFGLAAQLFSCMAKHIVKKLGAEEGEKVVKDAVEEFGLERGKRIAEKVKALGKPLSFKNWLVYSDIDTINFKPISSVSNEDFITKIKKCTFYNAAAEWGLEEYSKMYCNYVDYKIVEGYNPDILLKLEQRQDTGKKRCVFQYTMKEDNK
ncbi:MAG: L-2-amino-thiazoline-4-carboxylic acid hydrolase [archaeon]|nr:L-2-amino-thiazoline-4-carboxylic acid hydrolase [archaeon]